MNVRRFRLARLQRVLREDPTGTVEIIVALCFVMIPAALALGGVTELPSSTASLLEQLRVTEPGIGLVGIVLGLAQLWGAGTEWYRARAWISTSVAVLLTTMLTAYGVTDYLQRPTVSLMLGTVLAESFIAWRCWHERPRRPNGGDVHGAVLHGTTR